MVIPTKQSQLKPPREPEEVAPCISNTIARLEVVP